MTDATGETVTLVETIRKETVFNYHPGGWQLPCGCEGPGFWLREDKLQAYCDHCGRGNWTMDKGYSYCKMLDGKPQGPRVVVGAGYPRIDIKAVLQNA